MARGGSVEKVARRVAEKVMDRHVKAPRPRGHATKPRGGRSRVRGGGY